MGQLGAQFHRDSLTPITTVNVEDRSEGILRNFLGLNTETDKTKSHRREGHSRGRSKAIHDTAKLTHAEGKVREHPQIQADSSKRLYGEDIY
jgi:hypothetical protein